MNGQRSGPRPALIAGALFLAALGLYWGSAVLYGNPHTPASAYFNDLAEAFLRGRLFLTAPAATYDLTQFQGRWYVPFPPLPALLLLPWAAVAGAASINTVFFGALLGAANVSAAFLGLDALAGRGWTRLRWTDHLWLAALWGAGSVQWYMATLGSVWFLSQLATALFVLLAIYAVSATGSLWLGSAALALAMLGRPTVVLIWPLLAALKLELLGARLKAPEWRRWFLALAPALLPLLLSGGALLTYNYARFGSALDFGYLTENVARELAGDLRQYGQFNLHYAPRNLWYMWLALPEWQAPAGGLVPSLYGMSLLLTTPALLYVVRARRPLWIVGGAWLASGLVIATAALYYNTGWWQFGYRFSLDFMPALLVLLAAGAGARVGWLMRALILAGVAVNAWGMIWFNSV